ncbi:hypothetical protein EDD85DRAFT_865985 [Armillaria nabsnona]|nr:hypothetical protein EDD85DRAFT_865985 [Armillaria nabsnona]
MFEWRIFLVLLWCFTDLTLVPKGTPYIMTCSRSSPNQTQGMTSYITVVCLVHSLCMFLCFITHGVFIFRGTAKLIGRAWAVGRMRDPCQYSASLSYTLMMCVC